MSEGTTVKMYMVRMHKRSARADLEDAEDGMRMCERMLVAMAASKGADVDETPWYEHVAREVPGLLEEYADNYIKARAAHIMIGCPEDCDDDLDHYEEAKSEN